ncbi:MAG: hypothetical protein F6K15_35040 [Okeania sp. SIO2B3]|nr:hypothetical protein [Okeania sp. SIO2B3]
MITCPGCNFGSKQFSHPISNQLRSQLPVNVRGANINTHPENFDEDAIA